MAHTICTFNVNNLYARYRFGEVFPGDRTRKSAAEAGWGYLPLSNLGAIEIFNEEQRRLAARAITRGKTNPTKADYPDVLCLQEVKASSPFASSMTTISAVRTTTRSSSMGVT